MCRLTRSFVQGMCWGYSTAASHVPAQENLPATYKLLKGV